MARTVGLVPLECYLMQGDHPLPEAVIDKFRATGGELCKNVFLLSAFTSTLHSSQTRIGLRF